MDVTAKYPKQHLMAINNNGEKNGESPPTIKFLKRNKSTRLKCICFNRTFPPKNTAFLQESCFEHGD